VASTEDQHPPAVSVRTGAPNKEVETDSRDCAHLLAVHAFHFHRAASHVELLKLSFVIPDTSEV